MASEVSSSKVQLLRGDSPSSKLVVIQLVFDSILIKILLSISSFETSLSVRKLRAIEAFGLKRSNCAVEVNFVFKIFVIRL